MGIYHPSLFQVNTRVWLTELSSKLGKRATLDDIPDSELDNFAWRGFDWIWMLSVWQTGEAAKKISRSHAEWLHEFQETLPDLTEEDIGGSGFAIKAYEVPDALGGNAALARLRKRLSDRGMKLMLDFVPNHMALDHPWLTSNPDYFVDGNEEAVAKAPKNFVRLKSGQNEVIKAYGRDPYFEGWPDTLQLNYANPACYEAMAQELEKIASRCDGVRCDMAMLLLPDVFQRTWGQRPADFWPQATRRVREKHPGFLFMAEVYWDLEWTLQQQGFDYTYDKKLYDRLKDGHAIPVREHLMASPDFQNKSARFLENHDEPRIAATMITPQLKASAIITYFCPGLRFFHQGQLEGYRKRISPHLIRGPKESVDQILSSFYEKVLQILKEKTFRSGDWRLLECKAASAGSSFNNFIAALWRGQGGRLFLIAVNFSPVQSQCLVALPELGLVNQSCTFRDLLSDAKYTYPGNDMISHGLYLDEPGWKIYVFEILVDNT
ncbi:MAG TPA: alpha-amylase family glycosyl hydrolase [Cyclobacteriaceae bacterium]|nr:alpha-amylase family glycosyl hydrolase [Cyclobacteriaceae bacterium]